MIAGGEKTRPTAANPSRHSIKRNEKQPGYPSIRIESGKASISAEGKLVVTWENDPATLPQFAYTISVHADRAGKKGKALARVRSVTPHARQAELTLPANGPEGTLHVRLECGDILDNPSKPKVITLRR